MAFKMRNPFKQAKTSGFGPSTAWGGVKNPELVKTKKTKHKKVMEDGYVNSTQKKKIADEKARYEALTLAQKKAEQDAANDKADKFHKRGKYAE